MANEYIAWEWRFDVDVAYIGCGPIEKSIHPATILWQARKKNRSQLNDLLKDYKSEPDRSPAIPDIPLTKQDALQYAASRKAELKLKGVEIVSKRPFGTTKGGGAPLAVIDDTGREFSSVRAAAEAHDITPCTVSRLIRSPLSGWSTHS